MLNLFQHLSIAKYEIPKRVRDDAMSGDPEINSGRQKTADSGRWKKPIDPGRQKTPVRVEAGGGNPEMN